MPWRPKRRKAICKTSLTPKVNSVDRAGLLLLAFTIIPDYSQAPTSLGLATRPYFSADGADEAGRAAPVSSF
jgi:hypothetical protein